MARIFLAVLLAAIATSAIVGAQNPNFNATSADKKAASDVELINALGREAKLRKELEDSQFLLQKSFQPTTPDPILVAEQQKKMTSQLFGPNGIMNILNPKIMDQNDAATKLIPQLNIPPGFGGQRSVQAPAQFGQQPQQFQNQAFPQQQSTFPQLGQGFGGQQFPQQGFGGQGFPSQGFLPQQSVAQPAFASPFGGGAAQAPLMGGQFPQQFGR
jgi:hypothetical protein